MTTTTRSLLVTLALLAPAGAYAKGAAKPPPKPPKDLAPAIAALASADVEVAAKAAVDLGLEEQPAAHEALLDALALGLPTPVATEALAAITLHPAPPDVAALVRYAHHRNPTVRGAAVASLAAYPDPTAQAAIVAALHDQTTVVRAAAAQAAGRAKLRAAVKPLLALLEKGEEPAARGLAAFADADLARTIADELGKAPDPVLALCLGLVLRRPDFGPDPARVEVVGAIAKIHDPVATAQLQAYIEATPKNPPRPSRAEAETALIGGGK